MHSFHSCRLCKTEIPQDRLTDQIIVCPGCGWTDDSKQLANSWEQHKKTIGVFVILSIFICGFYMQSVHWGKYSFSVIPLKTQLLIGAADQNDFLRMAEICSERLKHECTEEMYDKILRLNPGNTEISGKLAKLQEKMQKNQLSIKSYGHYFLNGGNDTSLAHDYAILLHKAGYNDLADKYFRYALDSKPGIFQITVSKDYVTFLMNTRQYKKAKSFIIKIRRSGSNAPDFMEFELQEIKNHLVVAAR